MTDTFKQVSRVALLPSPPPDLHSRRTGYGGALTSSHPAPSLWTRRLGAGATAQGHMGGHMVTWSRPVFECPAS